MTRSNKIVLILLIVIGIFLMTDHIFTWIGVNSYGLITEANPIMKPLINKANVWVSITIKLAYYFALAFTIYKLNNKRPNSKTPYILGFVSMVYASVVVYHCMTWIRVVLTL